MREDFLWSEKYRPRVIDDAVLPTELATVFKQFVTDKEVPNLLLTGRAGVGKTTAAMAMLSELGADYYMINGSLHGNIDTLRNEITTYASSVSLNGGRKYVILDEADYLNANSTQPALRNFIESFSKNCGFILTCNYKNRIIPELHSRCSVVEFKIPSAEKPKLAAKFFKRVVEILKKENVEYDPKVVASVVEKHFPDFRRTLNELQRYAATGKIDSGILSNLLDVSINQLVEALKKKEFSTMRKWVAEHSDLDATTLFRKMYDTSSEFLKPGSVPQLVMIVADYQYKQAFVADSEINMVACLTEIMVECEFK
jgi:DNA polymerase III delta prime subunit